MYNSAVVVSAGATMELIPLSTSASQGAGAKPIESSVVSGFPRLAYPWSRRLVNSASSLIEVITDRDMTKR